RQENLVDTLSAIRPGELTLAALLYLGCVLSAIKRWQLLLRCRGVDEPWHRLAGYYFFSLFYSTFLPTSVAGDAVRILEVSRRVDRAPHVRPAEIRGASAPALAEGRAASAPGIGRDNAGRRGPRRARPVSRYRGRVPRFLPGRPPRLDRETAAGFAQRSRRR